MDSGLGAAWESWREAGDPRLEDVDHCELEELDLVGRYLGCANGVADLRTGRLLPPAEARRYRVTRTTKVMYDPSAQHPLVDRLTSHLADDLSGYIWRLLGRTMWAQPIKNFVLIMGPWHSGKSTIAMSVKHALGEEAAGAKSDILPPVRKDGRDGPTPAKADLAVRRFLYALEAETWQLDTAALKAASGEKDTVTYEVKYGPVVTKKLRATLWFFGNDAPGIDWTDIALANRAIPILYQAPATPQRTWDVEADDYKRAMLAKLVQCAMENPPERDDELEHGAPMVVQQERQRRIDTALGVFGVWLRDTFIRDDHGKVAHRDLWQRWADHIGKDAEDKTIGGQQSRAVGTQVRKAYGIAPTRFWLAGETAYGWQGIRLATDADLVCFAPLSGGTTCGQPLNAAGQCDVADTHADGGDSGSAPTEPTAPGFAGPTSTEPLSAAISTRRDALMATKTPDGRTRMVSAAESKAASALGELLDVGPDDILTPWHVSQLEDVDRLVRGIEATAAAFPVGEWADWRSVLHEAAVMISEDAQQRKPAPAALQGRVENLWAYLQPKLLKLPLGE